jgi:hypothetical protein
MALGLIEGTALYTDSTHLKASANKNKFDLSAWPSRERPIGRRSTRR